jgi:hypothetical protein
VNASSHRIQEGADGLRQEPPGEGATSKTQPCMLHLAIPLFTETSRSSSSDAVLRRLATQGNGNVAGVRIREPITTKSLVSAALFRSGVKGLLGQQALTPRGGNHIPHSLSPFQTVNVVSAYALARLVKYVFLQKRFSTPVQAGPLTCRAPMGWSSTAKFGGGASGKSLPLHGGSDG